MKKSQKRNMENKCKDELIEIIEKQNKLIAGLLNENAEKENMVEVLLKELELVD